MALSDFFIKMADSFSPPRYAKLSSVPITKSVKYFLGLIFLAFVIGFILMLPLIFSVKSEIQNELSKFQKLEINVDYNLSSDVHLFEERRFLSIEPASNRTTLKDEKVLVTDDYIILKLLPFVKEKKIERAEYTDLAKKSEEVSEALFSIWLLMLPAVLFMIYLGMFLKYAFIAIIAIFISFITIRTVRFEIEPQKLVNIVLFSSTVLIMVDAAIKPFFSTIYHLNYVVFVIYITLGIISNGGMEKPGKEVRD